MDSIPWDLLAYSTIKKLNENGKEDIKEILCFDELSGNPSGGTINTLLNSYAFKRGRKNRLPFDPFHKIPGTDEQCTNKFYPRNQKYMAYNPKAKSWVGSWELADGNGCIVRRSNAILNYGSKVVYKECLLYPNFMTAFNE